MRTKTYSYTEDEEKSTLTAVCISRQGMANLVRTCDDVQGSVTTTLEDLGEAQDGWAELIVERSATHEWRGLDEMQVLERVLKACEPALAGEWLSDMTESDETRRSILLCEDPEMPDAPELLTLDEASEELRNRAEAGEFADLQALAEAADKVLARTILGTALGLHIVYEDGMIFVTGRPMLWTMRKEDNCFGRYSVLDSLSLDMLARDYVVRNGYVEFEFATDRICLVEVEAEAEEDEEENA